LYTALLDEEQCKHLLLNTHTVVDGRLYQSSTKEGFDPAMRLMKGHLAAQLTLAACLARLCSQVWFFLACLADDSPLH